MKTNKFSTYINEANSSIMRVTSEGAEKLLKTNNDNTELRAFLKRETNFPNLGKIKDFIDWLDAYNNKIFEDWTNYVNVAFKKSDMFIYFDIDVNEDADMNKSYQQWYNQLTNKKPIIIYLIDDSVKSNPEKMERLYKIIKKMQINKNTTSTKDTLAQELESEIENKLDGKAPKADKVIAKYHNQKSGELDTNMGVEDEDIGGVDIVIDKYKNKDVEPESETDVETVINKYKDKH